MNDGLSPIYGWIVFDILVIFITVAVVNGTVFKRVLRKITYPTWGGNSVYRLTPRKTCFVIISFSPKMKRVYTTAIKPTVERLGFECKRVDEDNFNGPIIDRILLDIENAHFIIVDVTEARPNCYFEFGYAMRNVKNIIPIARNKEDIHFDVEGLNFTIYSGPTDLASKLQQRIQATVMNEAAE